ncbi:MAG: hypothetical protein B7Z14_17740 [Bosea sp. 32-68-6]|nr:MAG: hypothetical protein B7Z14_17740 [Bosea sp. 32-68-6]
MKPTPDPSLDAPTVVGHKPAGLLQPRAAPPPAYDLPTTPIMPPRPAQAPSVAPLASDRAASPPGGDIVARPPRGVVASRESGKDTGLQLASEPTAPADAIIAAASRLLVLVAQLRDSVEFADVATLRSLLNRFHNETWGGEKVFAILDRVKSEPRKNLPLLKLMNLVLLLGFEGMHRVLDNGRERLADLRDEVGTLVAQHSPPPPSELSAEWRGVSGQKTLRSFVPLWVVFAVTGFLLVCIYSYQHYRLSSHLAPVVEQLRGLATSVSPGTAP